jgi:hypothetical protein
MNSSRSTWAVTVNKDVFGLEIENPVPKLTVFLPLWEAEDLELVLEAEWRDGLGGSTGSGGAGM